MPNDHSTPPNPMLVTVAQAAKLLAISVVTVRRLMRDGRLPKVTIASTVRIPIAAVRALATPKPIDLTDTAGAADDDGDSGPDSGSS